MPPHTVTVSTTIQYLPIGMMNSAILSTMEGDGRLKFKGAGRLTLKSSEWS